MKILNGDFRLEPIAKFTPSKSIIDIVGYEVLSKTPSLLPYNNEKLMLAHDCKAVKFASEITKKANKYVHVNIEYSSLLMGSSFLGKHVSEGVVIEIVERLNLAKKWHAPMIKKTIEIMRSNGAIIAMDDVSMLDLEMEFISLIYPEIVKVDSVNSLDKVKSLRGMNFKIVAERIERLDSAILAHNMGANFIQGYWVNDSLS